MFKRLLIANRGEIAIRIARTAAEMGVATTAVYAEDDALSLHVKTADEARPLKGQGAAAYLDIAQIVALAREAGAEAVHPGYGFLAENAAFARACAEAGLVFIGPSPESLELFGDKARARALAEEADVPVLRGAKGGLSLKEAERFMAALAAPVMVKAVAGGGGRGMRPVMTLEDLPAAYERCRSEAKQSFGDDAVYLEEFLAPARHVEVQIAGDGARATHLWDRECSLQRQRQKIIEIAPALMIGDAMRARLLSAAVRIAEAAKYKNLGTIEFLVSGDRFVFIEANARLQVEHTVTEEVTGLDLVRAQIELAAGASLADVGLAEPPQTSGVALQARVNLEKLGADGALKPTGGVLAAYEPPSGPGVRVDGYGYAGYRTSGRYDSLLAKVIVAVGAEDMASVSAKAVRALAEFKIAGVETNAPLLQAILSDARVREGAFDTGFVEREAAALTAAQPHTKLYFETAAQAPRRAGAQIDARDPLAVLAHGKGEGAAVAVAEAQAALDTDIEGPEGTRALRAPLQGTIGAILVKIGDRVRAGQDALIMEAMKMEHVVAASAAGIVRAITVETGDTVFEDHPLIFIEEMGAGDEGGAVREEVDLDHIRGDLAEVMARQDKARDAARPDAVERRRKSGQRTARENIEDLCDPGSFLEYGALTVAARRRRSSLEELIDRTPADGLVMGFGRINGALFDEEHARAAAMSYDYTVLAGTQGAYNHLKMDRMFELVHRWKAPLVFFTEGGGGRPGDTEAAGPVRGFNLLGTLSGVAPFIGVTSGKCFAGNASVLGCCDVIIATKDSNIGMGGPAMIEGGGLGIYRPEEIGPVEDQEKSGVIDVTVADEAEAVIAAKHYLSFFQGRVKDWACADQRLLRRAIPENRLRVYDIRKLIETLCDEGSVLELRPRFGPGMITAFARIEGRPLGLIANNPTHLGGAIDSDGADKAARLMQICEAYDIPILSLSDTPGIMVGPEIERTGLVRHAARMFVIGANLSVPLLSVILRKSYGLGALAMTGGSNWASMFVTSWPTGEFGGMGLEGSVKLGYRNELAAIEDPAARKAKFDEMVAAAYQRGKALNQANGFIIDDVIDPADTRRWIVEALKAAGERPKGEGKRLKWIDTW